MEEARHQAETSVTVRLTATATVKAAALWQPTSELVNPLEEGLHQHRWWWRIRLRNLPSRRGRRRFHSLELLCQPQRHLWRAQALRRCLRQRLGLGHRVKP